jgi:hypothetical protein
VLNQPVSIRKPLISDGTTDHVEKPKETTPKPIPAKTEQTGEPKLVTPYEAPGKSSTLSDTEKPTEAIEVSPEKWTKEDVSQFLKQKDCGAYVESFLAKVSVIISELLCSSVFLP